MVWMLLADAASEVNPWAPAAAFVTLAGVVVWLAKAYRDDMKERAQASTESHEKVAAEFKKTSEETRDKFLAALDRHNETIDQLCDSVRSLHCNARPLPMEVAPPRSGPKIARTQ